MAHSFQGNESEPRSSLQLLSSLGHRAHWATNSGATQHCGADVHERSGVSPVKTLWEFKIPLVSLKAGNGGLSSVDPPAADNPNNDSIDFFFV